MAPVLKTGIPERVSGVRIPPSPPLHVPAVGARPVDKIKVPAIVKVVTDIQGRGALDIAQRALEATGQTFRYGIAHGDAKHNPADEIEPRDILR